MGSLTVPSNRCHSRAVAGICIYLFLSRHPSNGILISWVIKIAGSLEDYCWILRGAYGAVKLRKAVHMVNVECMISDGALTRSVIYSFILQIGRKIQLNAHRRAVIPLG